MLISDPTVVAFDKHFFASSAFDDLPYKRDDYDMIRNSSLSSLKGELFAHSFNNEGHHGFSVYGSNDNLKDLVKKSIF